MATVLLAIGAVNRKLPPIVYPSGVRSQLVLTSLPISRNSGLVARARGVSLFEFGQRKTAAIESRPVFVARPHSDVNVLEDFPRSDAAGAVGRFDEVVAYAAVVLSSQRIKEGERLGELFSAN